MARTPGCTASSYAALTLWCAGLSRPGPAAEPRGADPGPGAGASLQPGHRPAFAACAPSAPPGGARDPGAGRGDHRPRDRAGVSALGGVGHDPAGLGAGRAGQQGGGAWPRCARAWRPGGPRGRGWYGRIVLPCWPRPMGKRGRSRRGCRAGRGAGGGATTTGERCWEAELYRLKGELLLAAGRAADAGRGGSLLSVRPSTWPAASRRSRWSCGPP